jgi:hypothetical protein
LKISANQKDFFQKERHNMASLSEKLKLVKEAEEKARGIRIYYDQMARDAVSRARDEAASNMKKEEAKAREQGEAVMQELIEHANKEAEELRIEYTYDRIRLHEVVVGRRRAAVAFLVERLLKGD